MYGSLVGEKSVFAVFPEGVRYAFAFVTACLDCSGRREITPSLSYFPSALNRYDRSCRLSHVICYLKS